MNKQLVINHGQAINLTEATSIQAKVGDHYHVVINKDGQQIVVNEEIILENKLIDEAIKIIEGAGPPMQGIGTLMLYADSDSPNVKANFWLGKFGVQSQQLEN